MKSIEKRAYGKINLFLAVGDKLADGKHEVCTVMHRVGVFDTVTVSETEAGGVTLTCSDENIPTDEKNIAYAAALRYYESANISGGVHIDIKKRIPVTAGMGGGSSDAAAALLAMNCIYGALTLEELHVIAASLGADVPFFLYDTDAMLGCGSGTELSQCDCAKGLYGVFVSYGSKLSTGAAYAALDVKKKGDLTLKSADNVIKALAENDISALVGAIENDFELISEHFPEISKLLSELGSLRNFLCGSGPTVCGLFLSKGEALAACEKIKYPSFAASIGV
jgi:4-diphosphocytidyl-2-C-methyl-D-erythritol kinase